MSELVFKATETRPDGIRVTTTVAIPSEAEWPDAREVAELAQMGTSHTMSRVLDSRKRSTKEEYPF